MTQLTNYGENKIADYLRGQGITLPTHWHWALGSAGTDSSFTELSGTGYARQPLARSLDNYAGTQGAGSVLASTGTSHASSNNVDVSWGNPGGAWGTAGRVGLFDANSGGNCWMQFPLPSPIIITIGSPNPVAALAGTVQFTLGLLSCSDYLSNKLIDLIFRDQAYAYPATVYQALFSVAPTGAGGGTELSVVGYARKSLVPSTANLSGTQAVGSTSASSGSGGRTSINAALAFAAAFDAIVVAGALFDALTVGNMLFWSPVLDSAGAPTAKSLSSAGPAASVAADKLGITVD